jgi:membrane protein implicated in regulation of membrane protease activity
MICHNFLLEIFIFIVVCTVILFVAKPIVKRMISFNEEKTNARRFVNKKAVVVSEINNRTGAGQVSIGGEIWSCSSLDDSSILPGETVLIKGLRGVRLIVRHVASN